MAPGGPGGAEATAGQEALPGRPRGEAGLRRGLRGVGSGVGGRARPQRRRERGLRIGNSGRGGRGTVATSEHAVHPGRPRAARQRELLLLSTRELPHCGRRKHGQLFGEQSHEPRAPGVRGDGGGVQTGGHRGHEQHGPDGEHDGDDRHDGPARAQPVARTPVPVADRAVRRRRLPGHRPAHDPREPTGGLQVPPGPHDLQQRLLWQHLHQPEVRRHPPLAKSTGHPVADFPGATWDQDLRVYVGPRTAPGAQVQVV
mmetsp:Transcript_71287/g.119285  ORF Transcript_71287/g.119285 Transcript_71287/m.119285 type:complete len:257 (+) Transcript_71287:924-1694(+)